MKRFFDIVFAIVILCLFLPIGLLISILILLTDGAPIFYKQERIGQYGEPFYLLKFRSMRKNADQLGKLTVGMKDPRITPVGRFIRKYKLDEFPQFINVLKGEMSVVGPRPEVAEYVALYNDEQRKVLNVQPGITDYASIAYFDENRLLGESDNPKQLYISEIMPAKLALNQKYIQRPTLSHDLKIIWLTIKKTVVPVFS